MVRLVDGHPHDKRAEKAALSWGSTWRGDVYHSEARIGPRIVPRTKRRRLHTGTPGEILAQQSLAGKNHREDHFWSA